MTQDIKICQEVFGQFLYKKDLDLSVIFLFAAVIKCDFSGGRENGKCDDSNNLFECDWDGGDCCGCFVEEGICDACDCKDPDHSDINYCCKMDVMVNGICDTINNYALCRYDGLDCCSDLQRLKWDTDYECPLQENNCPMTMLLNQECDATVNDENCLRDMGQCCNTTSSMAGSICDINDGGIELSHLLSV